MRLGFCSTARRLVGIGGGAEPISALVMNDVVLNLPPLSSIEMLQQNEVRK